jgi:adenylate kinase
MRLVLLGAPGAGKGTQARQLAQHLRVPHISTGELLRAEVAAGSRLGQEAREVMARGGLVPDEVVLGMLEARLARPDVAAGFILDGYPRTLSQARALDALLARLGQPLERAVELKVAPALLLERLAGRARTEGRADDEPASVRARLALYEEQTAPVAELYRTQGRLETVDGVGSPEQVFRRVLEALHR